MLLFRFILKKKHGFIQNPNFALMKIPAYFMLKPSRLRFCLWLCFLVLGYSAQNQHICSKARHADYLFSNADTLISRDYDVYHALLDLKADFNDSTLSGSTTLTFTTLNKLQTLELDAGENLSVTSVFGHNQTPLNFRKVGQLLHIDFDEETDAGETYSVTVFHGSKADVNMFAPLSMDAHETGEVMWTLSQPYNAREWWPCNQVLNDKIDSIEIRITTRGDLTGVSNGVLVSDEYSGGERTSVWKHKHPIPAYLVAVAVSNYTLTKQILKPGGQVLTIKNYIFPQSVERFRKDMERGANTFYWFDSLLIPYPYIDEKYGHAQMLRWGGMEHTTISFMNNFNIELYTHELAHQWFGNLVTCGSWRDIWLNEGFATFFQGLIFESFLVGDDLPDYWHRWKTLKKQRILERPGGAVYVEDTTNVSRIFNGRLSYDKGAFVLLMLRERLGHDVFFEAVNNYLSDQNHADGYAKTPDVIAAFEQSCACDLSEFFNRWIYGQGFPVMDVVYETTGREMVLEVQQITTHGSVRFFPDSFELAFWKNGSAEVVKTALSRSEEVLRFSFEGEVDSITLDPRSVFLGEMRAVKKNVLNEVAVYPNPATDRITIDPADFRQSITAIRLYDVRGQLVWNFEGSEPPPVVVETASFTRGVYTLQINTESGEFTKKLILH